MPSGNPDVSTSWVSNATQMPSFKPALKLKKEEKDRIEGGNSESDCKPG
jgi:hypothetical protein